VRRKHLKPAAVRKRLRAIRFRIRAVMGEPWRPARIHFDVEALRANPPEGVTVSATDYYDFPHLAQE
jgi:hypothetical protein